MFGTNITNSLSGEAINLANWIKNRNPPKGQKENTNIQMGLDVRIDLYRVLVFRKQGFEFIYRSKMT